VRRRKMVTWLKPSKEEEDGYRAETNQVRRWKMVTWLHPAEKKKKGNHWQVVSSRPDNHSEKISAVDARIQAVMYCYAV
jgi:hypothetical protein